MGNFNDMIVDKGTVEPIVSDEGVPSDHQTVFATFRMPRVPTYTVQEYEYNHVSEEGIDKFGRWLMTVDWQPVLSEQDPSDMVAALHALLKKGIDLSFDKKTRRKKSSEPPWMADWLRDLIEDRRKIFHTDKGRSPRWQVVKSRVSKLVKKRKRKYNSHLLKKFEDETNPANFFKHIDGLLGANCKPRWSPMDMYTNVAPREVAEHLADYFNSISSEYSPLNMDNLPVNQSRELPVISDEDILVAIKKAKKPSSQVPGDVPPMVYGRYPNLFVAPVRAIFNQIVTTKKWPIQWKTEYVTVIPKNSNPSDPSECRNISCINFLSKLFESFVLSWCIEEVRPKLNQYGGEPSASASHLLIEVMDDVTSTMEDNRLGAVLSAINFSKAFNRLEHEQCLRSLLKKVCQTISPSCWDHF